MFAFNGQPMSGHSPSGTSQQCWVEQNDLDPGLLTTYFPNAAQDAFGLPCCKGTLMTYGLAWSPWGPPGVFLQSHFPADHPSSCSFSWGYFSLGAGLVFSFVGHHKIPAGLWLSFPRSLWEQPAGLWAALPSRCHQETCWEHCIPSSRSLMN